MHMPQMEQKKIATGICFKSLNLGFKFDLNPDSMSLKWGNSMKGACVGRRGSVGGADMKTSVQDVGLGLQLKSLNIKATVS